MVEIRGANGVVSVLIWGEEENLVPWHMIERCTGSVGLSATRGREAGLFGLELRQPSRATLHAGAEEYAAPIKISERTDGSGTMIPSRTTRRSSDSQLPG